MKLIVGCVLWAVACNLFAYFLDVDLTWRVIALVSLMCVFETMYKTITSEPF